MYRTSAKRNLFLTSLALAVLTIGCGQVEEQGDEESGQAQTSGEPSTDQADGEQGAPDKFLCLQVEIGSNVPRRLEPLVLPSGSSWQVYTGTTRHEYEIVGVERTIDIGEGSSACLCGRWNDTRGDVTISDVCPR
jgi:hypothetical protein